jgi:hypothetical protein
MKLFRFTILTLAFTLLHNVESLGAGDLKLYLGLTGGGGSMLTNNQLTNLPTNEGLVNVNNYKYGRAADAKGQLLLGIGRLRIGYQFLYVFSAPHISSDGYTPLVDNSRNTTYFNASRNNIFGNYLLVELAVINLPHFALVPGVAVGSFSGFKIDNDSHDRVNYYDDMHHPFSIGAELNAEIKFGRCALLLGPNYYLFALQDKATSDWHQYQHYIGADIGLRINLLR